MEATAGAETSISTLSISEDDRRDPYDLTAHFGDRPSHTLIVVVGHDLSAIQ